MKPSIPIVHTNARSDLHLKTRGAKSKRRQNELDTYSRARNKGVFLATEANIRIMKSQDLFCLLAEFIMFVMAVAGKVKRSGGVNALGGNSGGDADEGVEAAVVVEVVQVEWRSRWWQI